MTNQPLKLLLAAFVMLAAVGTAHAGNGLDAAYTPPQMHDIVRDANGNAVRSTSGDCVRTQWMNDHDACPNAEGEVISKEARTIYFPFNKSNLTKEAKHKLDTLAKELKSMGGVKGARIVGYADKMGSASYNEKLSKKRAETVRKYLSKKGVINAKLAETRWFGDTMPATDCPKDLARDKKIECLQKDRRVEVEIDYASEAK